MEILSKTVADQDFVVVGHSMGALIGTCMAHRTDRAKGIVAIEGSFATRDAHAVTPFAGAGGRVRLIDHLRTNSRSDSPKSYRAALESVDDAAFQGLARAVVERGGVLGRTFFHLPVPKLYVVGERAGAEGLSEHDLSGASPTLDVHIVRNAGHWAHCDSPDEVADTVEHWVAKRRVLT